MVYEDDDYAGGSATTVEVDLGLFATLGEFKR